MTKHIQSKQQSKAKAKDFRRVKPTVYGEVLTSNEIVNRLEAQEREKAAKRQIRKLKKLLRKLRRHHELPKKRQ